MSDDMLDEFTAACSACDGADYDFDSYFIGAMSSQADIDPVVAAAFREAIACAERCVAKAAVRAVDSRSPDGGVVDDGTTTDGGPL